METFCLSLKKQRLALCAFSSGECGAQMGRTRKESGVRVRGEGGGVSGFCAWLAADFKMEKAPVFLRSE